MVLWKSLSLRNFIQEGIPSPLTPSLLVAFYDTSLLEERSEIPIVLLLHLCRWLPSQTGETAKVYKIDEKVQSVG